MVIKWFTHTTGAENKD